MFECDIQSAIVPVAILPEFLPGEVGLAEAQDSVIKDVKGNLKV